MDDTLVVWLILAVIVIAAFLKARAGSQALEQANRAYKDALTALEDDPSNTALRQTVLRKGRALGKVQRRLNAETAKPRFIVHDETAIRNDLEAIAAIPHDRRSIADELDKLATLAQEGVITHAEFNRLKSRLAGQNSGAQDVIRLLRGLKDLEREGVLTTSEFQMKKWDVLSKRLPLEE